MPYSQRAFSFGASRIRRSHGKATALGFPLALFPIFLLVLAPLGFKEWGLKIDNARASELKAFSRDSSESVASQPRTLTSSAASSNAGAGGSGIKSLTVCSQNLNNFGLESRSRKSKNKKSNKNRSKRRKGAQLNHLVNRIIEAKCDLVAVQELTGKNHKLSLGRLRVLSKALTKIDGRNYKVFAGPSRDDRIRNGFILASDVAEKIDTESLIDDNLPGFRRNDRPARFSRGPYILKFRVPGSDEKLALINVHFKSKASSYKDKTKTKFELLRMRMAAKVSDEAESLLKDGYVVMVAGDFNSRRESSSLDILSGELELSRFSVGRDEASCRVDKRLESQCRNVKAQQSLVPVLANAIENKQKIGGTGSYRYKGQQELIDDILIDRKSLSLMKSGGKFNAGLQGSFGKGSDHKLVWARLEFAN